MQIFSILSNKVEVKIIIKSLGQSLFSKSLGCRVYVRVGPLLSCSPLYTHHLEPFLAQEYLKHLLNNQYLHIMFEI